MPVYFIVKRQRWKTLCLLKHEGKREFRRFSRAYAAPACSDQVQMESLLTFFVHQIEKGFSFDTYQYGRGRGALRNIADLSARLIESDARWRDKSIYKDMVLALGEYCRRHGGPAHGGLQAGHYLRPCGLRLMHLRTGHLSRRGPRRLF